MNPLRTLLSIFPHPLHAFMSQGRIYVYVSEGPHLENRQPFHDFIFGTRHFAQPLQGRRISRVPKTTSTSRLPEYFSFARKILQPSLRRKQTGKKNTCCWPPQLVPDRQKICLQWIGRDSTQQEPFGCSGAEEGTLPIFTFFWGGSTKSKLWVNHDVILPSEKVLENKTHVNFPLKNIHLKIIVPTKRKWKTSGTLVRKTTAPTPRKTNIPSAPAGPCVVKKSQAFSKYLVQWNGLGPLLGCPRKLATGF